MNTLMIKLRGNMFKKLLIFSFIFSFSVCFGKEGNNSQKIPLCSSQMAKLEVIKRLDKIYGKNYLTQPIIVRSENNVWDVCSKRAPNPKKIVHVKVNKNSKKCEIKSIIHYEDSVVVNTGTTQSFLAMKQEIECNPEKQIKTINIVTKHPYPYLQKDFSCKNYDLKENSELCKKLNHFNNR